MDALTTLYLIVLRFTHIVLGAFWVGAGLFLALFLAPAVKASGPDGGKVMGRLVLGTRWTAAIGAAAGLTVLSGILLYVRDWLAFGGMSWVTSGPGLGFTLGGLAGLIGVIHGGAVVGRTSTLLAQRGAALQAAGRPPTPEEQAELGALQAKMDSASSQSAIILAAAIILMAIARYLVF